MLPNAEVLPRKLEKATIPGPSEVDLSALGVLQDLRAVVLKVSSWIF